MTSKEKAKELIDSFYWELEDNYKSKQCALITVDEILLHEKENHSVLDKMTEYWQEVKQEIEKL